MAEITRTHGSAFGVVANDRGTAGSGAIAADELVVLNGPRTFQATLKIFVTN